MESFRIHVSGLFSSCCRFQWEDADARSVMGMKAVTQCTYSDNQIADDERSWTPRHFGVESGCPTLCHCNMSAFPFSVDISPEFNRRNSFPCKPIFKELIHIFESFIKSISGDRNTGLCCLRDHSGTEKGSRDYSTRPTRGLTRAFQMRHVVADFTPELS